MTKPYACPHCKRPDFDGEHCRHCGCRAFENPVSGHTIYRIRGRLVAAPDDLREQMAKKDGRYSIDGPDPLDLTQETAEDADH